MIPKPLNRPSATRVLRNCLLLVTYLRHIYVAINITPRGYEISNNRTGTNDGGNNMLTCSYL